MDTVVVGLGNVLASDDAVGVEVVRRLAAELLPADVRLVEAATPGLDLVPMLLDFDKAVLVDAIGRGSRPGAVHRLVEEQLSAPGQRPLSAHGISVLDALEVGRILYPERMPRETVLIGIEVENLDGYQDRLTPAVRAAIPAAVQAVLAELRKPRP